MTNKTFAALALTAAAFASTAAMAENLDNPVFVTANAAGVALTRTQVQADLAQYQQQLSSQPARAETTRFVAVDTQAAPALSRADVAAAAAQSVALHQAAEVGADQEMPL